jgi:thiol-disulfide isomerase/thioredoxin
VSLADFRGKETLVLLWDTGCGFCRQMLPELLALEADPPRDGPRLLVVIPGDSGSPQAVNFRSAVVIDRDSSAARALGLDGTPVAVLIDANGTIASDVVVGARAVLDLASGEPSARTRASA